MIDKVHAHILDELRINARADTAFIIASVVLNFITLAVNAEIIGSADYFIAAVVFILLTLVVSFSAEVGLIKGRAASAKLIRGLIKMYEDHDVGDYYDKSLLSHYRIRYNIFILIVFSTGLVAILVPFLLM